MEALAFLGLLGILGIIAGDKLWPIIRHFLQPAIQISDPDSKRLTLSRADAIKALWADMKHMKKDLKVIWTEEHGFWQRVKMSLGTLSGNHHQVLRPLDTNIELQFGFFAILSVVSFVILNIFIPFFLAEGLQGGATVQATTGFEDKYYSSSIDAIVDERLRDRVRWDFKTCINDRGVWSQTHYCAELRNALPSYKSENMELTDPSFTDPQYHFLIERGDKNFSALRLSLNTSLQDVAFNKKPGGEQLLHELTCVPAAMNQLVTKVNGSFNLGIEKLIPSSSALIEGPYVLHESMILKTSNAVGSGYEIYESKTGSKDAHTKPVNNDGDQGATWYQTDVDATLPWIEYNGPAATSERAFRASQLVGGGNRGAPLQNFLITFKPGESDGWPTSPSDDPIFGAHRPRGINWYVADREVSALSCTEIFKICLANQCTWPSRIDRSDWWLEVCYPGIMSVWVNALFDPTYGTHQIYGRLRNFLRSGPAHRLRWQDDVEERFIRSMLRVRYASKYVAEQSLVKPVWGDEPWASNPLLYRNSDFTNVNIWGSVATAAGYLYIIAASYWPILLLPLILPLRILAAATSTGLEKFNALADFGRIQIHVPDRAIQHPGWVGNLLRRRRPRSLNILPMDTWHAPQEEDEPDNPPRMARN